MSLQNSSLDFIFSKEQPFQAVMNRLRSILLDLDLKEELKWKQPCYTYQNRNIVLIAVFKDSCCLSFLKGVLLSDPYKVLESPGENSQYVRFLRFVSENEVIDKENIIKQYVQEAMEKSDQKVEVEEKSESDFIPELKEKLASDEAFYDAFESLTPGRKRAYNIYFAGSKNSETRKARIERYTPRILIRKGMHDCVCGHSARMPSCDGSHKKYGLSDKV